MVEEKQIQNEIDNDADSRVYELGFHIVPMVGEDGIAKEMTEVRKAFEILPDGATPPVGYQKIPCHMVFDVKMEDFAARHALLQEGT